MSITCRNSENVKPTKIKLSIRRIVPFKNGILKYQTYYVSIIYIHCVYYFFMDDRKHVTCLMMWNTAFQPELFYFKLFKKGRIYNEIILYTSKCLTNQMLFLFLGRGVGLIPVWKENRFVVNKIFYNFLFEISFFVFACEKEKMQIISGP